MVKAGWTDALAEDRAKKLRTKGVPLPFTVEFGAETSFPKQAETAAHAMLAEHQVSADREFFRVPPHIAIEAVRDALLDAASINAAHRTLFLHGCHGAVPPMALIALVAPMARSTNRSTAAASDPLCPATVRDIAEGVRLMSARAGAAITEADGLQRPGEPAMVVVPADPAARGIGDRLCGLKIPGMPVSEPRRRHRGERPRASAR